MEQEQTIEQPLRRRKKPKKRTGKKIGITVICLLVIAICGYFIFQQFIKQTAPVDEITNIVEEVPTKKVTTFQEETNKQWDSLKEAGFTGTQEEATLASQVFALNLFTIWGVNNADEYNGQDFIPEEYKDAFNKTIQNTLLFRYPTLIDTYGVDNLPIVVAVTAELDSESYATFRDTKYDSYTFTVTMQYQDGTFAGTTNADSLKTQELVNKWVHSAEITMFYYTNDEGVGQWLVSEVINVVGNNAE